MIKQVAMWAFAAVFAVSIVAEQANATDINIDDSSINSALEVQVGDTNFNMDLSSIDEAIANGTINVDSINEAMAKANIEQTLSEQGFAIPESVEEAINNASNGISQAIDSSVGAEALAQIESAAFDHAVEKTMADNPGLSRAEAEKAVANGPK